VARQIDDQGAAGPLRIRRGVRLRDSQLGDPRVEDIGHYIVHGVLWQAFECEQPSVVLIDEIDKADIEFPNDLLRELDRMEFHCYELHRTIKARHRPLIIITSNNEKELPDAFLRRCFFHYIKFPDKETMQRIVEVHFPVLKHELLKEALEVFFDLRDVPGLKKKPSTSELIDWLKLLLAEDIPPEALRARRRRTPSRRCTARCSRTSRTCTCSNGWLHASRRK
jgi:MoxR-like ATPase